MKSSNFKGDADDVEALLRAAQDDVLLKLSLNSHIAKAPASSSSSSSSSIDPDLDSRLQALKSRKSKSKSNLDESPANFQKKNPEKAENIDDLYARFAALRGSIPAHSNQVALGEENEEDEVEQVIKWAIDAARLDLSPPSDEGEEDGADDGSDDEGDDDNCDDDEGVDHHKVVAAKKKSKKK